jgi:hypothetical protein
MGRALTRDEVTAYLEDRNFEVVDFLEYKTGSDKITVRCKICGTTRTTKFRSIVAYKDGSCAKCISTRRPTFLYQLTNEAIEKFVNNNNHQIVDWKDYRKTTDRLGLRCRNCGREWEPTFQAYRTYKNGACSECERNAQRLDDIRKLEERAKENNHTILQIKNYKCSDDPIKMQCNNCGLVWLVEYWNYMKNSCPGCKIATEQKIIDSAKKRGHTFLGFGEANGVFRNNRDTVNLKCDRCSRTWNTPFWIYSAGFNGCSVCNFGTTRRLNFLTHSSRRRNRNLEYNNWAANVKERCENRCVISLKPLIGYETGTHQCHHLNGFDHFEHLRFEPSNGVLLEQSVHMDFHNKFGYGNNTENQFSEYCKTYHNLDWEERKRFLFP